MTLKLTMRPGLEDILVAQARSSGQSLEDFIQQILEREAAATQAISESSGIEKARAFRAWAMSLQAPASRHILSLDDISRENIYRRD